MLESRDKYSPAWDVLDELRDARYWCRAFSERANMIQSVSKWIRISLAVFAPSSAAILFLQQTGSAGMLEVAQILSAVSATLALAEPVLGLDSEAAKLRRVQGHHAILEHDLHALARSISASRQFSQYHIAEFEKLMWAKKMLAGDRSDLNLWKRVKNRIQAEVATELPSTQFFIPSPYAGPTPPTIPSEPSAEADPSELSAETDPSEPATETGGRTRQRLPG